MSASDPAVWVPSADSPVLLPESDAANAKRLRHYCSDRLRWGDFGWQTYANGLWRVDEAGAVAIAAGLGGWIYREAEQLRVDGATADADRRARWADESQSRQRIEDALWLARGLIGSAARPLPGLEPELPSDREQIYAACIYALARPGGDTDLRAAKSGRIVAAKVVTRINQCATKLWPGTGRPPMPDDRMVRLISDATNGRLAGANYWS